LQRGEARCRMRKSTHHARAAAASGVTRKVLMKMATAPGVGLEPSSRIIVMMIAARALLPRRVMPQVDTPAHGACNDLRARTPYQRAAMPMHRCVNTADFPNSGGGVLECFGRWIIQGSLGSSHGHMAQDLALRPYQIDVIKRRCHQPGCFTVHLQTRSCHAGRGAGDALLVLPA